MIYNRRNNTLSNCRNNSYCIKSVPSLCNNYVRCYIQNYSFSYIGFYRWFIQTIKHLLVCQNQWCGIIHTITIDSQDLIVNFGRIVRILIECMKPYTTNRQQDSNSKHAHSNDLYKHKTKSYILPLPQIWFRYNIQKTLYNSKYNIEKNGLSWNALWIQYNKIGKWSIRLQ